MTTYIFQSIITLALIGSLNCNQPVEKSLALRKYDEKVLRKQYLEFIDTLNYLDVVIDYRKAVEDLLSDNPERQIVAIKTLGETNQPNIIPWMIPFLDSKDSNLRIYAVLSIEKIVSSWALKRRDMLHPEAVVLKPLSNDEFDMRPLAWLILQMFRWPDDGNTHAYAATMTRYLELTEFEYELRACLKSRHPAVKNKARWALESLGFSISPEKKEAQAEQCELAPED